MCYHIQSPQIEKLQAFSDKHLVGLDFQPAEYTAYYHVSGHEHPRLPVLSGNQVRLLEWGLIPSDVKDPSAATNIREQTLNAEAETIFDHPSFKQSIFKDRGVLLVEGFFQWREYGGKKYPYFIQDEALLRIGCTISEWMDPSTGELRTTFSIITTPANKKMEVIHNTGKRMPLILEDFKKWLEPDLQQPDIASLILPYRGELKAWTVSDKLNLEGKEKTNVPDISKPVSYPELPDL